MQLHRDHLIIRILGTVFGVCFLIIGLYVIVAVSDSISDVDKKDRSMAFGITATIGGLAAIFASWAEERMKKIWCAHPPRLLRKRNQAKTGG